MLACFLSRYSPVQLRLPLTKDGCSLLVPHRQFRRARCVCRVSIDVCLFVPVFCSFVYYKPSRVVSRAMTPVLLLLNPSRLLSVQFICDLIGFTQILALVNKLTKFSHFIRLYIIIPS